MNIFQIPCDNGLRNFSYLILGDNGDIYCIDPNNANRVLTQLDNLDGNLVAIINTHGHFDHIQGNLSIISKTKCKNIGLSNNRGKSSFITDYIDVGEKIDLGGNWKLELKLTPGHTLDHTSIFILNGEDVYAAFMGDTLFNAGVGNCHNGGNPQTLYHTIKRYISSLSNDVLIYPGHDYMEENLRFTLAVEPKNKYANNLLNKYLNEPNEKNIVNNLEMERKINCFLRLKNKDLVNNLRLKYHDLSNDPKEVFLKLRELRDNW